MAHLQKRPKPPPWRFRLFADKLRARPHKRQHDLEKLCKMKFGVCRRAWRQGPSIPVAVLEHAGVDMETKGRTDEGLIQA